MNKKKVLHLIQSLDNGGCENMLLRTMPLLSGTDNQVITLRKLGELAPEFSKNGIIVHSVLQKSLLDFGAYVRLAREVQKTKPDLIITYLLHADIVGRLFLQFLIKAPVIPFLRTNYNHQKYWSARLFERTTKFLVKQYLANSEAVKNFYVDTYNINSEKIIVIPNGIDVGRQKISDMEKDEIKRELGLSVNNFVVVCVANLSPNKGHRYLLKAFDKVYQKHENMTLLLVGDGTERSNLETQIKNYKSRNAIKFLGTRHDVSQLLAISDIFVLPTLFEGMSNAIMEAMASSLAVITTDIPENKELITNDYNGILIKTNDFVTLELSITKLVNDPTYKQILEENAQRTIEDKYNLNLIADKLSKALLDF